MASLPVAGRGHLHCAKQKEILFMSGGTNWRTPRNYAQINNSPATGSAGLLFQVIE